MCQVILAFSVVLRGRRTTALQRYKVSSNIRTLLLDNFGVLL